MQASFEKPRKFLAFTLAPGDEPSEPQHPGEEPLKPPPAPIAPEPAAVWVLRFHRSGAR